MCYSNADEIALTIKEWNALFPDGLPNSYIFMNSLIGIGILLPIIKKESVKEFMQWATTKNAEFALQRASCPIEGNFPLLNASRNSQ